MRFYLGTHEPAWLARTALPLFVSHRRLARRKRLPVARGPWALDSGGFTEIDRNGQYLEPARVYAAAAERYQAEVGRLVFAAPQDWMCEPQMIRKTGRSVREHQKLTLESVLTLRSLAPSVPWIPVLQGWTPEDYLRHAEDYEAAGVDLADEPTVGVGSVCKRQSAPIAAEIFAPLWGLGLRLHGFGLKVSGVAMCWPWLASSDSMAWSLQARKRTPMRGCEHPRCVNCRRYAMRWRRQVIAQIGRASQLRLPL